MASAGAKKYLDIFQRVDKKVELSGRVVTACGCIVASVHFANKCHKPKGSGEGGEFAPADECGEGGGMTLDEALGSPAPPKTSPAKKASAPASGPATGVPKGPFGPEQFNAKGKPNPGTPAWLHAHGIDHETFNDRPYHRFEEGQTYDDLPPSIQALYADEPEAKRQLNKIMRQEPGYIMVRNSVDGSPIVPQTRPDAPIVTNPGQEAFRHTIYNNAVKRAAAMRELTPEGVVELQQGRIDRAKVRLEEAKTMTRDKFLHPASERVVTAENALVEAKKNGDPDVVAKAGEDLVKAKRTQTSLEKQATHNFGGPNDPPEVRAAREEEYRAVTTANETKSIANATKKLAKYKENPTDAIANEIENADKNVISAKESWDGTAVKYVFPPNPSKLKSAIDKGEILGKAGRVNIHGEENIRRLKEEHGRVYLAMEGCIKEDALLTAVRLEGDKTSAVISVPSVTLWRHKEMAAVADKYLRGREVVLIPDADGVNNPRVQNEARAMQSFLVSRGAKVVVAPPPIPLDAKGNPVPTFKIDKNGKPVKTGKVELYENTITDSPKGTKEELKGVDDYLGLGAGTPAKGTLGNLAVQHRVVPHIDTNELGLAGVATKAIPNTVKALSALSNIIGPSGSGRVGQRMLSAAIGNFHDHGVTAGRTIEYLARAEIDGQPIAKVELVFDPVELKRGRRAMHPDMTEARIDELVKNHVIERPSFGDEDSRPVELGYEETPIITLHPKYRAVDSPPTPLGTHKGKK